MSCEGSCNYHQPSHECLPQGLEDRSTFKGENRVLGAVTESEDNRNAMACVALVLEAKSSVDDVRKLNLSFQKNNVRGSENAIDETNSHSLVFQTGEEANMLVSHKDEAVLSEYDTELLIKTYPSNPGGSWELDEKSCNQLVEVVVKGTPTVDAEDDICCICLEEYTDENPMLYGECKHHFHVPCLMAWKQRSNVCPMCASETLRGLADDIERMQPVAVASDDVLSILLERYAHRPGRRHRHMNSSRTRIQELPASNAGEVSVFERLRAQVGPRRNTALNQRQSLTGNRGHDCRIATHRPSNADVSRKSPEQGRHVANENKEHNAFMSFLNRVFFCCKK